MFIFLLEKMLAHAHAVECIQDLAKLCGNSQSSLTLRCSTLNKNCNLQIGPNDSTPAKKCISRILVDENTLLEQAQLVPKPLPIPGTFGSSFTTTIVGRNFVHKVPNMVTISSKTTGVPNINKLPTKYLYLGNAVANMFQRTYESNSSLQGAVTM